MGWGGGRRRLGGGFRGVWEAGRVMVEGVRVQIKVTKDGCKVQA